MAQTLRNEFHATLADLMLNDLQLLKANYYFYLGRLEPWDGSDTVPISSQTLSQQQDDLIRSNIAYVTKLTPNDVTLSAVRYNWKNGIVYAPWDHTVDMTTLPFYVITSENKVFKCLDNNGGVGSTVEPSVISYDVTPTDDGYLWKYMYSVPLFKRTKFANPQYIPVQNAISDSFYNKGSIEDITIVNPGSGYNDDDLTTIVVSGGTLTGTGAAATVQTVDAAGRILTVLISSGGSGYTKGVTINIATAYGVGAVLTPVFSAGVITALTITESGTGYAPGDVINLTTGGAVFRPIISRQTGQITSVYTISEGSGYVTPPSLIVTKDVGQPGTNLYSVNDLVGTAILTAVLDQGSVKRVLINDPGKDYATGGSTTISVISGDGDVEAQFSPVIYNGSIIAVVIENPGSGYTFINLAVYNSGSGQGGQVSGVITKSNFSTDQSIVEQSTKPGAIYKIKVTNPGQNYTENTVVTVTDVDGSGAEIDQVNIQGGQILGITMKLNRYGTGYTNPIINITDPTRVSSNEVIDAEAIAIIPPIGGHGFNAVHELYATTMTVSSLLRSQKDLVELKQDFRQFGILRNPTQYANGRFLLVENEIVGFHVRLNTIVDLAKDEVLRMGSLYYRVADINSEESVWLQPLSRLMSDPNGTLLSVNDNRSYVVLEVKSRPAINKYSGSLLFVSDETPFQFTDEQGISIKTYIKF